MHEMVPRHSNQGATKGKIQIYKDIDLLVRLSRESDDDAPPGSY